MLSLTARGGTERKVFNRSKRANGNLARILERFALLKMDHTCNLLNIVKIRYPLRTLCAVPHGISA